MYRTIGIRLDPAKWKTRIVGKPVGRCEVIETHARLQRTGQPERGSEITGRRRHRLLSDTRQATYGQQKRNRPRGMNDTSTPKPNGIRSIRRLPSGQIERSADHSPASGRRARCDRRWRRKFTELVLLNNLHRSHPSRAPPPLHNVEELLIERGLATVRCFTVRGWSRLTTAYGASWRARSRH